MSTNEPTENEICVQTLAIQNNIKPSILQKRVLRRKIPCRLYKKRKYIDKKYIPDVLACLRDLTSSLNKEYYRIAVQDADGFYYVEHAGISLNVAKKYARQYDSLNVSFVIRSCKTNRNEYVI